MPDKLSPQEIEKQLPYFIGTEHYYKWSVLFPKFVLTDGAKYVADNAGAYWLMDLIASHQPKVRKITEFQVWKLEKTGSSAVVRCEDGNYHEIMRQEIEYIDFPLDKIDLWAQYDGNNLVIFLPSEY